MKIHYHQNQTTSFPSLIRRGHFQNLLVCNRYHFLAKTVLGAHDYFLGCLLNRNSRSLINYSSFNITCIFPAAVFSICYRYLAHPIMCALSLDRIQLDYDFFFNCHSVRVFALIFPHISFTLSPLVSNIEEHCN